MRKGPFVRASVVAAFAATAVVGCGHSRDREASDLKIIGGTDVPDGQQDARRVSTVALTTEVVRSGTTPLIDQGHSFCSGTLINRRAIVTAAHCIQKFDETTKQKLNEWILPQDRDFLVHFDVKVARAGQWRRAVKVVPHPDWSPEQTLSPQPSGAPNDLGVIILAEDAPAKAVVATLASPSVTLQKDMNVDLSGYGVTKTRDQNDTGTLRQVQVPVTSVDGGIRRVGVGAFFRGACAGDSGGPAWVKVGGQYQLFGATSTGAELGGQCLGLMNNYTDLRYYADWINGVLHANGVL